MANKSIVVLGAYGGTGKVVCEWLLKATSVDLVIAGRRIEKANALAERLRKVFPDRMIKPVYADASNRESLLKAFLGQRMVVVASTTTSYVKQVAESALDVGIDYLDYHFESKGLPILNALSARISREGRCFITQAGFHPGLPSAFVRYAAPNFDQYNKASIGMAMQAHIEKAESVYELVDAIADYKADLFKDGQWRQGTYKDVKKFDFGSRFGVRSCYPIQMGEMRPLPEMFDLQETGVYVAGFNWFVDSLVFPLAYILFKIKKGLGRHLIAKLMVWGLQRFSGSQQGVSFVLETEGMHNGEALAVRIMAEHNDAYAFTAIPIIACLRQYLDGSFLKPGLWMMGHLVDPVRLFKDMTEMGITIQSNITNVEP
ncbi:MAG: saccharopine dehydrogenase NADP-binding domain-containing protein [Chlamydiota bacterium]|nr:saccharopine dehydrogenase NADP-binding domain-containing protein [Chlamydiota bacterium]